MTAINLETDGRFPREPEPIPENLGDLSRLVRQARADIGMAVDPDVDRLALVDETGPADRRGLHAGVRGARGAGRRACGHADTAASPVVVANLSTSRWWSRTPPASYGRPVRPRPGGRGQRGPARSGPRGPLIGGEGNGGVILPSLHIGRDAPLGVALDLAVPCTRNPRPFRRWSAAAPGYTIVKAKAAARGGPAGGVRSELRRGSRTPPRTIGTGSGWPGPTGGCTSGPRGPSRSSG